MKITSKDIDQVALLSRLELSGGDSEEMTEQLNAILNYMEMLNKVDTDNVEPTAHVLPLKNVTRPDIMTASLPQELALANAPEQEDGYFKVSKIMEG